MAPIVQPCDHAGAEIHGVELRNLTQDDFVFIREQFFQHGVVFFRGQSLSPEEHLQFARRLGRINVNRFFTAIDGYPEIAQVLKEKDQKVNIGEGFHSDHSYDVEPALGSVLVARELPNNGGDTLFVDMHKAYETLPTKLKSRIEQMNAVHTSSHVFRQVGKLNTGTAGLTGRLGNSDVATQVAVHPVVITHPDSGRKVLYVNPGFTLHFEGMTVAESRPLLDELYNHAVKQEHVHRLRWNLGTVALWDNRAMWHCALNDYHGQRRLMHRVTIEGGKLSHLNETDQLPSLWLAADANEAVYNPWDDLNTSLRHKALSFSEVQPSKL